MTGIALIGAGRMATVHAELIHQMNARVVSVYDPNQNEAQRLANNTGADIAQSAAQAMRHVNAYAILIATSSNTHADLISTALDCGKPIFCEKPLTESFTTSETCIKKIGKDKAKQIFLGFNRRFDPNHAALARSVHANKIGALEQVIITSRDPHPPPIDYIAQSGGLFNDMTIHDFDMARWLVQSTPIELVACGSCLVDSQIATAGDIDTASVVLKTKNGAIITIFNSRRAVYGYDQRIEAFGNKGMLISNNVEQNTVKLYTDAHAGSPSVLHNFFLERYSDSYKIAIQTFLSCAQANKDMPVNALDGLEAARLAHAAHVSYTQRQWIENKEGEQ